MRPLVTFAGLLVLAFACAPTAHAEDIDLFLKSPLSAGARPNLLLVIDNAANNDSAITQFPKATGKNKLDMLRDLLDILMHPLTSDFFPSCDVKITTDSSNNKIEVRNPKGCSTPDEANNLINNLNLGLMLFNPSSGSKGGYVLSHIRPMNVLANRDKLWSKVENGIPKANNAPYAKTMHEAYLYFSGKPAYAGFSTSSYDPDAKTGSNYTSVITDSCQPNYILFIGNGGPDSSEEKESRDLLNGLGGVLSSDPIRFTPDNLISSWFDEYARTLNRLDLSTLAGAQKATTYTVAVQSPSDNNFNTAGNQSSRALLQSAALNGGGEYALGQDAASVLKALLDAARKMQPVNSVFAAATLPVSVNVRGTFLNQVYMGQFRPDENAKPRWPGNLKQYQIGTAANGEPVLQDHSSPSPKPVEDTVKGFLLPDVTSFWTKDSAYWGFTTMAANDAPDGSVVEKGGAAQRLRSDFATSTLQAKRKLYTCNGSCGASGTLFSSTLFNTANTSGPTTATLVVSDEAARTALIDWVRGADNKDDENKNGVLTDARAYIHGDLLHSRPAVVNYNRSALAADKDRDVVVYYGTNDGIFHAVKGGQDDSDGGEKWGIVFPEFFGKLKLLRDNDKVIQPSSPKPYFADGPVSLYQDDVNKDGRLVAADGDKVYLYVAMRRGGRFAYALDVSDPDAPKFLWKIDANTTGFSELGQTWSTLRPTNIKALTTGPVVVFGAGYDPDSEDPSPAATGNVMGRGIFVVNGVTGALIKQINPAGMGSISGDLTVLDRDGDGKADRIYAADSKANVWRVDIDNADPALWKSYKIATLGGTGADGRKFLNKVDVVFGTTFDAVLVGSGDREHPFETGIVDRFYMLQDTFVGLSGGLFCTTDAAPVSCTHSHLTDITNSPQGTVAATSHGWYLTFATGEKLVDSPITVFGAVIFGTNQPVSDTAGTCGNLGRARLYQVDFKTGNAAKDLNGDGVVDASDRSQEIPGGGFLPSGVYSPVEIDGKRKDVVCVGTHCFKPGGAGFDTRRQRTYWYKKQ